MRTIEDHKTPRNELNEKLQITVIDEPGHGGACHHYLIHQEGATVGSDGRTEGVLEITFQNGPIQEHGVNGISQEALLAILIDRLTCFQAGPYPCEENDQALEACEYALDYLHDRTRRRLARGVEGTSAK